MSGQAPRAGVSGIFRDWAALLETGAGMGGGGWASITSACPALYSQGLGLREEGDKDSGHSYCSFKIHSGTNFSQSP